MMPTNPRPWPRVWYRDGARSSRTCRSGQRTRDFGGSCWSSRRRSSLALLSTRSRPTCACPHRCSSCSPASAISPASFRRARSGSSITRRRADRRGRADRDPLRRRPADRLAAASGRELRPDRGARDCGHFPDCGGGGRARPYDDPARPGRPPRSSARLAPTDPRSCSRCSAAATSAAGCRPSSRVSRAPTIRSRSRSSSACSRTRPDAVRRRRRAATFCVEMVVGAAVGIGGRCCLVRAMRHDPLPREGFYPCARSPSPG